MRPIAIKNISRLMFGILIVILLLICGLAWVELNATRSARIWSQHTDDVIITIKDLNLAVRNAETGQRGFLLTGRDDYLAPYEAVLGRVTFLTGELQRLTADSPAEQARLQALSPVLQHKLEELAQTVQLRRSLGLDAALAIVLTDAGRNSMKQIEATLAAMVSDENALLTHRVALVTQRSMWAHWLMLSGMALGLLALFWARRILIRTWDHARQVEAEQRITVLQLRASLDSLSQGVGVFDATHQLSNWNDCFRVLLDLPKALVRGGTPYAVFNEHMSGNDTLFLESEGEIHQECPSPKKLIVYERTRSNGMHLELRRALMPDGGFVLTVTDMTKRTQAEAVLREAQKMQAIGQLTGGIAHDFNNLLTIIMGNLEMTRSKLNSDPKLQARIDRASTAAQRGATLTAQLLAFARKQPLAPAPLDLTTIMPELMPLMQRTLGANIDVRYFEAEGLWLALADYAQLENAILNLALNARDAMPGGGRLTIEIANKVLDEEYARVHHEVIPGDYAMLAVSDTGHGMTDEVLARVFEPFFTTKPDGKGTGLGLAMVFGFVKQSGGHIKIYSKPGDGTTVRLYLPRTLGAAQSKPLVDVPIALPCGNATILVVEDEPAVREIAVAILTEAGYRVLEAADGDEGLRVFGAHATEVTLLLTDVIMPGSLRGPELAERINAIRPDVQIIYMSGYSGSSIMQDGCLDDNVQLVGKPFRCDELIRKVAAILGSAASTPPSNLVNFRINRNSDLLRSKVEYSVQHYFGRSF